MSSSPKADRSPLTKVNPDINESLLTNAFDDCLKLVEKSVNSNKSVQGGQTRKEIPKKVKKEPEQKYELTHKSRKFRYTDEPKVSNPPIVMPPPPFDIGKLPLSEDQDEARTSMLMSWYMAGYHTGYYEAMRKFNK